MIRLPIPHRPTVALLLLSVLAACAGGEGTATEQVSTEAAVVKPRAPANPGGAAASQEWEVPSAELADHRARLLVCAHAAADMLPAEPHIKTRSRLQESVAGAYLVLEQPALALEVADGIANWRRGAALADVAFYHARRDQRDRAVSLIQRAAAEARRIGRSDGDQAWRRDRIRAKVARACLALGDEPAARPFAEGLVDSELSTLASEQALRLDSVGVDAAVAALADSVRTASLDQSVAVVELATELFARFYADVDRRVEIETGLLESASKLPPQVCLRMLATLTTAALDHQDAATALRHVAEMQGVIDGQRWLFEHRVPLVARVAALRYRAGERGRALTELEDQWRSFQQRGHAIVDVFRTEALLPLAEAFAEVGESGRAEAVYGQALREAFANPNGRPRVEDYVGLCCSLAQSAVVPSEELVVRIESAAVELGAPW